MHEQMAKVLDKCPHCNLRAEMWFSRHELVSALQTRTLSFYHLACDQKWVWRLNDVRRASIREQLQRLERIA